MFEKVWNFVGILFVAVGIFIISGEPEAGLAMKDYLLMEVIGIVLLALGGTMVFAFAQVWYEQRKEE